MEIKIENYLSQEEIKEIIKDKISNYIDSDIKNTIEIAIKYSFFELLPKNYIDEFPKIELFARQKTEGWDIWGNELKNDIEMARYLSENDLPFTVNEYKEIINKR